ncbi:unnamed protein product [Microthlaspi erraticum]|uniref:Uncharacterized protein n=1 Tax=Microthlaspi erraticum TaxID=1685480 RepID=A0A6D2HGV0_9BRAS|nr:unnamed protein product [Microthlaspi erraticum]
MEALAPRSRQRWLIGSLRTGLCAGGVVLLRFPLDRFAWLYIGLLEPDGGQSSFFPVRSVFSGFSFRVAPFSPPFVWKFRFFCAFGGDSKAIGSMMLLGSVLADFGEWTWKSE